MRKLRVLYDATLAGNPAGTGTFTRGLLGALQQRPDLEITTSSLTSGSVESLDLGRKPPASRLRNSLRHFGYYLNTLPQRARQTGADVIFCPSALVPWRGRTPLTMTVYDLTVRRYPQTLDPLSRLYAARMLRVGLRRSRVVCTISQAVAGEIQAEKGFPGRPVRVAYPGPSPELAAATPEPVALDGLPFLLMVGTLEPRKNHITALRAFAAYRERNPAARMQLVLAGSPGWRYAAVLAAIDELGLAQQVRRPGALSPGRLRWLYEHARALLFPSLYEGFGLPVLEAFSLRCPVVASNIAPVREIAGASTAELLDAQSIADWTDAIERLAGGPAPPAVIASAAARAREFTWERCADAVASALLEASPAG